MTRFLPRLKPWVSALLSYEDEYIGEYQSNVIRAYASKDDANGAEWNTPCLLVSGSLSPELEEACDEVFGLDFDYHTIRNHYVIVGDGLTQQHKDQLVDAVSQAPYIFEEDKRHFVSSINTAAFI